MSLVPGMVEGETWYHTKWGFLTVPFIDRRYGSHIHFKTRTGKTIGRSPDTLSREYKKGMWYRVPDMPLPGAEVRYNFKRIGEVSIRRQPEGVEVLLDTFPCRTAKAFHVPEAEWPELCVAHRVTKHI